MGALKQTIKRYSCSLSAVEDLAIGRLSRGVKTKPNQLAHHQKQVGGAEQQVPPPEPARLRAQTEEPFQAAILHPLRRLSQCTGQKWEGCAHSQQRHSQPVVKFVGPDLLAGTAQADKDNLSA